jgi:hypothetical protein
LCCSEAVEECGDVVHKARSSELHAWVGRNAQVFGLEVAVEAVDEDGVELERLVGGQPLSKLNDLLDRV